MEFMAEGPASMWPCGSRPRRDLGIIFFTTLSVRFSIHLVDFFYVFSDAPFTPSLLFFSLQNREGRQRGVATFGV